jgi:hypothetical protein
MGSSIPQPNIVAFKADAAIAKGKAVKIGTDAQHVAVCSAASDKSIGIVQSVGSAAEDMLEVALPGGGAKALSGGTISAGDLLVPDSNGALVASSSNAERAIAVALEGAASGDLFAVMVSAQII